MPEDKPRVSCGHYEWHDGHCATMQCPNYINKCDKHGVGGFLGYDKGGCSLEETR